MKADQKEYRCGVCNEYAFENITITNNFKCPICMTEFIRDVIGIMISKNPSDDWKKKNVEVWDSIKEINYPPNYMEIFTTL